MSTTGKDVIVLVDLVQSETFHAFAALSWLFYDWILGFDDELQLIWHSTCTLPKILYFVSRYFGLFYQGSLAFRILPLYCTQALVFNSVALFILVISVELCLTIRVYALYRRSRLVFYVLLASFVGEIACLFTVDGTVFPGLYHNITHYPSDWPIRGCFYPPVPAYFKANWVPVLAFETVLFVLMCIKCYSYRPMWDVPILLCIWRDGTAYYLVILVAILMSTIAPYKSNIFLENWASIWISAIFSISGARLLLSVRALSAARRHLEVLTPVFSESENLPDITDASETQVQPSPVEVHELLACHVRRAPILPRTTEGCTSSDTLQRQDSANPRWLREWEATSLAMSRD